MDITGRKLFVKALEEEGVDTIFAYPGGTVTDLFDELYKTNSINLVLPRHEQGLIHEAEGYAKSTGKVGVCLVTSGPVLPTQLRVLQMRIMTMCHLCALQDRYRFHLSEMMPFRKWI